MSILNIQEQLTGGESVYCINQAQMTRTKNLVASDSKSGEKVRQVLAELEANLSRNEQAALAFTLIEHLNNHN